MRRLEWEDVPPPVRDPVSGCLRWQGKHHSRGYGMLGGKRFAHRVAWEREHGPIPRGLTVDHVAARGCIWRDCVWTAHMEIVTQSVNTQRSSRSIDQRSRTHCPKRHEYTPANTITKKGRNGRTKRECRKCNKIRLRDRYARNRDAINAGRRQQYAIRRMVA